VVPPDPVRSQGFNLFEYDLVKMAYDRPGTPLLNASDRSGGTCHAICTSPG